MIAAHNHTSASGPRPRPVLSEQFSVPPSSISDLQMGRNTTGPRARQPPEGRPLDPYTYTYTNLN
eukprot:scaffold158325_cov33-Tisochrysis_lutea.AAC.1